MDFQPINYTCIRCGIWLMDVDKVPMTCPGCNMCVKCDEMIKVINDGIKQCGCKTWVA